MTTTETYANPAVTEQIARWYRMPLLDLVHAAAGVHRQHHDPGKVQMCTLSSVKTGACPEDCAYCPQSARYSTEVEPHALLSEDTVLAQAKAARANGSSRFCMGAAWRDLPQGENFDRVVGLIGAVSELGLEVCCTMGMLTADQALRLAEAGLHTYNHNVDTSPEYYPAIITTRAYEDRLRTLSHVRNAGIRVCSGGIIGMGESSQDRRNFLAVLASLEPQPDSVPINCLIPVPGTPLADSPPLDPLELVRVVAVARLSMPDSMVRLSAGRLNLSDEAQALCFLAGANSIHTGEKLLTTPNPGQDRDHALFEKLDLQPLPASL